MRVNIWIPDKLLPEIKKAAESKGKSLSGYLVSLHMKPERDEPAYFNPQPKLKQSRG